MEIEGPRKGWFSLTPGELIEAINNLGPENIEVAGGEIERAIQVSFPSYYGELMAWVQARSKVGAKRERD